MSATTELVRQEIHFSGRVQGVGFRYTTAHLATNHDVCGFVRNLPDGGVFLVVEGRSSEVESLVKSVRREMEDNIVDVDVSKKDYVGEFDRFRIDR